MKKLCTNFKVLFYTSALMALTLGVCLSSCSKDDSGTGGVKQKSAGKKVNLVEIPDIKFRAYLMAIIPDAFPDGGDKMDANSDVVKNLRRIDVYYKVGMKSMKGIEYFTALTYLTLIIPDKLEELDLTKNTALVFLSCRNSKLTNLDLSQNKALAFLGCGNSKLTNLDLSQNKALLYLDCYKNNLTSLNLEHNTALIDLDCYENNLTSLNLEHNTALTELNCNSNKLTSLNLEHNTALTQLKCNSNNLTSLDLSHNCKLIRSDTNVNPQEKGNDATVTWCPER